ncbi:MAG: NAD-dependent epimerase/dehydratase family protein [Pseudomonadota bacterium]
MSILVTGATGYIGRRIANRLAAMGQNVIGTVRDDRRVAALPPGVRPVFLDLADPEPWGPAAATADAVIHTAFAAHDADFARAVAADHAVIAAMADAMKGSDKPLIVSNGSVFLGPSNGAPLDENTPVDPLHPAAARAHATAQIHTTRGLRAVELRLASFVHGHGGSIFLPAMVAAARRDGRSIYVGDGTAGSSTLHVDSAVDAYLATLTRSNAQGIFHVASRHSPSIREIAIAVGRATGTDAVAVSREEASEALDPFLAMFLDVDNRLDSSRARQDLGWDEADHPDILSDVAHGSYA